MRSRIILAVALLSLAVAAPVSAGWSPVIGGPGRPAVELHLDPDRPELLYARVPAYPGGFLWRSLDAGTTWRTLQTGLGHRVSALAVDPGDPRVIWAWTPEGELWRSGDAGETWSRRFTGSIVFNPGVVQLLVDPRQPETIYRLEEGRSGDRFGLRVAVSRDGGATFHTGAFLPHMYSKDQIFVSSRSGELLAFTKTGLAVSADGGRTWRMRGRFHKGFRTGTVASSDPDTLYALSAGSDRLVRSDDAGANWRTLPRLPRYNIGYNNVAVDQRNARHVWLSAYVAGDHGDPYWIFESKDGGETWSPPFSMPSAGPVPAGGQILYTSVINTYSETGLYMSQDGGRHWQPKDQGIAAGDLEGLVAQALPDGRRSLLALTSIYYGYRHGLIRSDGGEAWVRLPLRADSIESTEDSAVVATAVRGLVRSEDGGNSWSAAAPAPPGASSLLSDLNQPRYLAVRSHVGEEGFGDAFLWTSDDGGASWRFASDGLPMACGHEAGTDFCASFWGYAVDPFDAKRRWVVNLSSVFGPPELFASQDAGASWQPVAVNLPAGTWIIDLAADPTVRDRLLAGTFRGLLVSEDGGAHWSSLGQGLPRDRFMRPIVRDGRTGTWYVVATWSGARYHSAIYRSLDGGASWTLLAGAPDTSVAGILVDPASPGALLAVFPGQGLWIWRD